MEINTQHYIQVKHLSVIITIKLWLSRHLEPLVYVTYSLLKMNQMH